MSNLIVSNCHVFEICIDVCLHKQTWLKVTTRAKCASRMWQIVRPSRNSKLLCSRNLDIRMLELLGCRLSWNYENWKVLEYQLYWLLGILAYHIHIKLIYYYMLFPMGVRSLVCLEHSSQNMMKRRSFHAKAPAQSYMQYTMAANLAGSLSNQMTNSSNSYLANWLAT